MFLVLTTKFHVIIEYCVLRYRMQLNGEEKSGDMIGEVLDELYFEQTTTLLR